MAVAYPHEWELFLGEAWWRSIVGLPETAESGQGGTIWNLMRLNQGMMRGEIIDYSVIFLSVPVSTGFCEEAATAYAAFYPTTP